MGPSASATRARRTSPNWPTPRPRPVISACRSAWRSRPTPATRSISADLARHPGLGFRRGVRGGGLLALELTAPRRFRARRELLVLQAQGALDRGLFGLI